jgi:hypothetical protein
MAIVLLVRRVLSRVACKYDQSSAEAPTRREVIQVQQRSGTPAFRDGKKVAADSAGNILDSLLHSFGRSRRIHPPKSRSILRKRRTGSLRPCLIVVGWIRARCSHEQRRPPQSTGGEARRSMGFAQHHVTTVYRCVWVDAVSLAPALVRSPMASPDSTSSTRRFCLRPSAVSLDATGAVFPKPLALIASEEIPCCTR